MKTYLMLAWRNIWRNRRRTLISIASILFALSLAWITRAMQHGSYDKMISSVVSFYTGYIQIHQHGYWEKRSLDKSFACSERMQKRILSLDHVVSTTARLEGFSLVGYGSITKGASVIGIQPQSENDMTKLSARLVSGKYLTPGSDGLLVALGLARQLHAEVGDTLVLYGQGYHGIIAAGKYPVAGLVKYPTPEFNTTMVFMCLDASQYFYAASGLVNDLAVMVDSEKHVSQVQEALKKQFPADEYEVMNWREMLPDVVQGIELDSAGGILMLMVLYMVIGFGILGTVMMMVHERTREFGILTAVGMKKTRLALVSVLESLFISLLGILSGIAVTIPILAYWYRHPIYLGGEAAEAFAKYGYEAVLPVSIDPGILLWQSVTVLAIALAASSYSLVYIGVLQPARAMRT